MRGLSSHWIFIRFVCGNVRSTFFRQESDIDLRVIGHHALIHPIKGKERSIGTPESTLFNPKFVTVNTLTINNFT